MEISTRNSLAQYLGILKPTISSDLISPQCWDNIESVATTLPNAISTFFGFECRLGIEEAHADFLVCAEAQAMGREVLAGNCSAALAAPLYVHPVWQQIHDFSQHWNNQDTPLYDGVNNIWLEFDIVREKSLPSDGLFANIPVPSFFFGPQSIYSDSDARWTIYDALKLIKNKDVPQVVATNLLNCYNLLPEGAYVFQIGVMLARESDLVRVCIRDIYPEQIADYLTALGWPGSIEKLNKTLDELSSYVARIDLDIDIGESILPKIGLECYFKKQPQFEPRWYLLLDYLVENEFCTIQKRDSLLSYTGYLRGQPRPDYLPDNLEKIYSLLGYRYEGIFFKGLHHIKLTFQEDKALEAKAYLYISQQLITPKFVEDFKSLKNSDELA